MKVLLIAAALALFSAHAVACEAPAVDVPPPAGVRAPSWSYETRPAQMGSDSVIRSASIMSVGAVQGGCLGPGIHFAMFAVRQRSTRHAYDLLLKIDGSEIVTSETARIDARLDSGKMVHFASEYPSDGSMDVVFLDASRKARNAFVAQLARATTLQLRVTLYRSGTHVFTFHVQGFSPAALHSVRVTSASVALGAQ